MNDSRIGDERPLRILVLEDSLDDVLLLERQLSHDLSVSLRHVDALGAFSTALEAEPWDVILADYNLGGFTALDALTILKSTGKDVPFIIVSGSIGEESAARAMRAGAHDFFLKDKVARLSVAIERERREAANRRERREAVAERERLMGDLRLALQTRDEFLRIAAHELRTPLTPLLLQLSSARRTLDRAANAEEGDAPLDRLGGQIDKALSHVKRITLLVNSLLDATRISGGRYEIKRTNVELGDIVRTVVATAYETLQRSGSPLSVLAPAPVRGCWDPVALATAIGNVLSNAIKFGGGQTIEISVGRRGEGAIVSVKDGGIGMPSEALERIFERFERAVPIESYGGFGVGLWTTREIVEAHGGRVEVSSEEGAGSTFTLELPLEGAAA
jgi:signal transduction histidine kinase